jgi:hypothetical protein
VKASKWVILKWTLQWQLVHLQYNISAACLAPIFSHHSTVKCLSALISFSPFTLPYPDNHQALLSVCGLIYRQIFVLDISYKRNHTICDLVSDFFHIVSSMLKHVAVLHSFYGWTSVHFIVVFYYALAIIHWQGFLLFTCITAMHTCVPTLVWEHAFCSLWYLLRSGLVTSYDNPMFNFSPCF